MIWVFLGQSLLIGSLFTFGESFPHWLLNIAVLTAICLPILGYLTVVIERQVYRGWFGVAHELWRAVLTSLPALRKCFNLATFVRLTRVVSHMRVCPDTASAWFALCLFPFKVYVVLASPCLWLGMLCACLVDPKFAKAGYGGAVQILSIGYPHSLFILLAGALLQALFCERGRSGNTVLIFLTGLGLFWMLFR